MVIYLTVDCAQLESGKIAFYEFCNSEMTNLIHYSLEKFNLLSKIADITYLVYYSIEKNRAVVYQSGRDSFGDKETIIDGNIQDFNKWYSYKNNVKNKDGKNPSKPFGDILSGGDPYVENDVVYEIMLKQGLDLTYPISETKVGDAVVYDIAFGAIFVVLGDKITSEVASHIIKQIADEEAENPVVVLQDEKFINDSEKLNTIEQLNASGIQYNDILSI